MSLNYYLSRSALGDNVAGYEAAKIMQSEKYNEVMVQGQLRRAAMLGNIEAMRWLGFLGLNGKLIKPDSTVRNVSYYNTYEESYRWFSEGAEKGDPISLFVVGTCLNHGIGTSQDIAKSEEIISNTKKDISIDIIISIVFLLNTLHSPENSNHKLLDNYLKQNTLDNQGGQHGEKY